MKGVCAALNFESVKSDEHDAHMLSCQETKTKSVFAMFAIHRVQISQNLQHM